MKSGRDGVAVAAVIIIVILVVVGMIFWMGHNTKKQPVIAIGTQTPQVQQQPTDDNSMFDFSDGLKKPQKTDTYQLDDTGAGMAEQNTFAYDINQDGIPDRIVRTRQENGTSHYWEEYSLELNIDGRFHDITPAGKFRTTMGAECALTRVQFVWEPRFQIIKISRPWVDSWTTPSMATRTIYEIQNNKVVIVDIQELRSVCDVSELFM